MDTPLRHQGTLLHPTLPASRSSNSIDEVPSPIKAPVSPSRSRRASSVLANLSGVSPRYSTTSLGLRSSLDRTSGLTREQARARSEVLTPPATLHGSDGASSQSGRATPGRVENGVRVAPPLRHRRSHSSPLTSPTYSRTLPADRGASRHETPPPARVREDARPKSRRRPSSPGNQSSGDDDTARFRSVARWSDDKAVASVPTELSEPATSPDSSRYHLREPTVVARTNSSSSTVSAADRSYRARSPPSPVEDRDIRASTSAFTLEDRAYDSSERRPASSRGSAPRARDSRRASAKQSYVRDRTHDEAGATDGVITSDSTRVVHSRGSFADAGHVVPPLRRSADGSRTQLSQSAPGSDGNPSPSLRASPNFLITDGPYPTRSSGAAQRQSAGTVETYSAGRALPRTSSVSTVSSHGDLREPSSRHDESIASHSPAMSRYSMRSRESAAFDRDSRAWTASPDESRSYTVSGRRSRTDTREITSRTDIRDVFDRPRSRAASQAAPSPPVGYRPSSRSSDVGSESWWDEIDAIRSRGALGRPASRLSSGPSTTPPRRPAMPRERERTLRGRPSTLSLRGEDSVPRDVSDRIALASTVRSATALGHIGTAAISSTLNPNGSSRASKRFSSPLADHPASSPHHALLIRAANDLTQHLFHPENERLTPELAAQLSALVKATHGLNIGLRALSQKVTELHVQCVVNDAAGPVLAAEELTELERSAKHLSRHSDEQIRCLTEVLLGFGRSSLYTHRDSLIGDSPRSKASTSSPLRPRSQMRSRQLFEHDASRSASALARPATAAKYTPNPPQGIESALRRSRDRGTPEKDAHHPAVTRSPTMRMTRHSRGVTTSVDAIDAFAATSSPDHSGASWHSSTLDEARYLPTRARSASGPVSPFRERQGRAAEALRAVDRERPARRVY